MPSLDSVVSGLKFTSVDTVGKQFRKLDLKVKDVGPAVGLALTRSETRGLRLAHGILASAPTETRGLNECRALINWASATGSRERRLVARAVRVSSDNLVLVHELTRLPRQTARPFFVDYFASGGDMKAVARWLQVSGHVLRTHRVKRGDTMGFIEDAAEWVGDKVESGVDAIAEGAETLVDSVVNAGKSLVDVVTEVVNWSVAQVADLVAALIEAGQSIGQILDAALQQSLESLRKFVKAMVQAGRAIGESLEWAIVNGGGMLLDVVQALREAGTAVGNILAWAAEQALDVATAIVQTLINVGQSVAQIIAAAVTVGTAILQATLRAALSLGQTIADLLVAVVTNPASVFSATVQALLDIGRTVGELFEAAGAAIADGVQRVAQTLVSLGRAALELIDWAIDKAGAVLRDVIGGIIAAGKRVVDLVADVATRGLAMMQKVVAELFALGRTFAGLLHDLVSLAGDALSTFVQAALALGRTVAEFVGHTLTRTYTLAAKLVKAALAAGVAVAELLAEVAGDTYWALRKIVNGVLKALGPVGEILDWVLSQAENATGALWHQALDAIRYAGGKLTSALDWALAKGQQALEAVIRAWESVDEALEDVYTWVKKQAQTVGDAIWETIGSITVKLENSISYVLLYLQKDFVPGIRRFVKGALDAGLAIGEFVAFLAERPLKVCVEIVGALLESGVTLGQLLIETVQHPDQALANLLRAAQAVGKTLKDIYHAAIVESGEQFLKEVTLTLRKLERPVVDMLEAVAEVAAGAVATVITILLGTLASYRPLTAQEKAEAKPIFGDSIDLDKISVSSESLLNKVIFGLQDWASKTQNSRAFTTETLINFDVDDGIERHTLIHELTHVWQALVTGPFYMAEAIHAQNTAAGYNYGYSKAKTPTVTIPTDFAGATKTLRVGEATGEGAQQRLLDEGGNFDAFNREQQAQITMHYFVRRFLLAQSPAVYGLWQPYIDVVRAA